MSSDRSLMPGSDGKHERSTIPRAHGQLPLHQPHSIGGVDPPHCIHNQRIAGRKAPQNSTVGAQSHGLLPGPTKQDVLPNAADLGDEDRAILREVIRLSAKQMRKPLSYYTAIAYIPSIRDGIRAGRAHRVADAG